MCFRKTTSARKIPNCTECRWGVSKRGNIVRMLNKFKTCTWKTKGAVQLEFHKTTVCQLLYLLTDRDSFKHLNFKIFRCIRNSGIRKTKKSSKAWIGNPKLELGKVFYLSRQVPYSGRLNSLIFMCTIRWVATFGAQVHFQMCKCQSMESKIFKLKSNKIKYMMTSWTLATRYWMMLKMRILKMITTS